MEWMRCTRGGYEELPIVLLYSLKGREHAGGREDNIKDELAGYKVFTNSESLSVWCCEDNELADRGEFLVATTVCKPLKA
jgi:hypothetical protein